MNIYINENIVRSSIVKMLSEKYPTIEIYKEQVPQGFKTPSFHVYRINVSMSRGYQGHGYNFDTNAYNYVIRYFPASKDRPIEEINDIITDLSVLFKDVIIYNIIEGKEEESEKITIPVHTTRRDAETQDNILTFVISFNIRTVDVIDLEKVKTLELIEKIKEED